MGPQVCLQAADLSGGGPRGLGLQGCGEEREDYGVGRDGGGTWKTK